MQFLIRLFSFFLFIQMLSYTQEISAEVSVKEDWIRVYLATYPRSGNHWMRNLLEEANHIVTSSVYCDHEPEHLKTPFDWGGYAPPNGYEGNCRYPNPGEIIVIKTHFPAKRLTEFDLKPAPRIIRIVRHPIDSFYSHFLHQKNEIPADGKIPHWFVKRSVRNWEKFEKYWNQQPNVLTIRYEDILSNPIFYLKKIITTIGYSVSDEDVKRAVEKFPPQGGYLKHLKDYHTIDLKLISTKLRFLMQKYDYTLNE